MVGLAGEGQNFDGNGMYVRFQSAAATRPSPRARCAASSPAVLTNVTQVPLGSRPKFPGSIPPYRPDVRCYTNAVPGVNGPAAAVGGEARPIVAPAARAADPAAARRPAPAPRSSSAETVAGQLLSRLNPFPREAGR